LRYNKLSGKEKQRQKMKERNQISKECVLVSLLVRATKPLSWFQCKTNKEAMVLLSLGLKSTGLRQY
jgi:hypothetical protein